MRGTRENHSGAGRTIQHHRWAIDLVLGGRRTYRAPDARESGAKSTQDTRWATENEISSRRIAWVTMCIGAFSDLYLQRGVVIINPGNDKKKHDFRVYIVMALPRENDLAALKGPCGCATRRNALQVARSHGKTYHGTLPLRVCGVSYLNGLE